jgi:hypothetical protein
MLRYACATALVLAFNACASEARTASEPATDAAVTMDARVTEPAPPPDGAMDASDDGASAPIAQDGATVPPLDAETYDAGADANDVAPPDASPQDAAGDADAAQLPPDGSDVCEAISIEPADGEHACLHALHGPFVALALSSTPQGAPDASRAHTAFQLTWPDGDTSHGYVRFRAAQAGMYAVFCAQAEVISVTSASRDYALPATRATQTYCDSLPSATLVELGAGEWSTMQLAHLPGADAQIVIERIAAPGPSPDSCACDDDAGCSPPLACRSDGPCRFDHECCSFCHDADHCH